MALPLALVFDSRDDLRSRVADALGAAGFEPVAASSPQDALEIFRTLSLSAAVLGIASPAESLFDLLGRGLTLRPSAVIAVMDSSASLRPLDAARAGAFDLIPRPPEPERLAAFAWRAAAQVRLVEELRLARAASSAPGGDPIVGRSEAIDRVRRKVARIAEGAGPALFVGEPGSGRTHAARALFSRLGLEPEIVAARAPGAESAIFGGAPGVHVTDLEDLPWRAQERLAEMLSVTGGPTRLTASSRLDPRAASRDGRLHAGLVEAFGTSVVEIPPLRARLEDVPLLARAFVEGIRRLNALPPIALQPEAVRALETAPWPGNVQDLRGAVETAVILAADGIVREQDFPPALKRAGPPHSPPPGVRADRGFREAKRAVVHAFERVYLTDLLERYRGNVTGAASRSGMLRSALQRLLRKHDLRSAEFRSANPRGDLGDRSA